MSRTSSTKARLLARVAAPVMLASVLGACSSVPDWVDPTGWFGSDSQPSSDQGSPTADAAQPADSGQTPDLAGIPPKPTPPSTPDEQQQVANSLAADRAQAHYSSETLEGGTEAVAAPPPPAQSSTGPTDEASAAPAAPAAGSATDSTPSSDTAASTAENAAPPPAGNAVTAQQPAAAADSSGTQVASTEQPATSVPAAAPMAAATGGAVPPAADMQTTFAPSHAPALDPSISRYVPQRILSRYQQTAAAAAVPGVQGMSMGAGARPVHRRKTKAVQTEPTTEAAAPAQ